MIIKRIGSFFLDIIEVVVLAIAIFLFVYLLILQPHKIKGASMEPNLPNGQYLLTDKLTYRFREPERGDVIVFSAPANEGEEFIKRIIGIPGERVAIKDGLVYINGMLLVENYLAEGTTTPSGIFLKENEEILVPKDNYIVLGDNRRFSSDSRAWGFISKDEITGRAWLIYWPIPEAGLIEEVEYSFN